MPPRAPLSSATTLKRIQREVADLKKEDLGDIVLAPTEENMFLWKGSIPGPEGSIYEGGVFRFEVHLPADYPFSAPKVLFKTRIYHMNISESGNICIDILKANWSPALSLFKVMLSLSSLLTDPNPKDPLVPSIATQYTRNRKLHDKTAREWTELYARPPKPLIVPAPSKATIPPAASSASATTSAKGKKKAEPQQGSGTSNSRSSVQISSGPIVIEDSDDEEARPSRRTKSTALKRKHSTGERVEIVLSDDEDRKKKSTGPKKSRPLARAPSAQGSIIIIDDD